MNKKSIKEIEIEISSWLSPYGYTLFYLWCSRDMDWANHFVKKRLVMNKKLWLFRNFFKYAHNGYIWESMVRHATISNSGEYIKDNLYRDLDFWEGNYLRLLKINNIKNNMLKNA